MTATARPGIRKSTTHSLGKDLDNHGSTLAPTDTRAAQTIAPAAAPKSVQQVQRDACAACSQGMAQSYCSPIDVGSLTVELQLLLDCEVLCCKGLVHFDEVHVFEGQAGLRKRLTRCGSGTNAHIRRLDSRAGPREQSADGLESAFRRKASAGHDQCRGAI